MTRKSIVSLSAVLAIAFATSVNACDKKGSKKDGKTVATTVDTTVATKSAGCSKSAKSATLTTSAKTVATASSPCCGKCEKSGKTASGAKFDCHKGLATLTAGAKCNKGRVAAILASMPSMSYRVANFDSHCMYSAKAKAEETKAAVTFVVDGKAYDSRGDASVALASLLTDRANEMSEVTLAVGDQTFNCPHAAQGVAAKSNAKVRYQLAGFEFDDKEQATKLSKKLHETISAAAVTVKADGKTVFCAKSASASGKTVTYVVGDEETSCDKHAKLLLAQQLVRTIVETAAGAAL